MTISSPTSSYTAGRRMRDRVAPGILTVGLMFGSLYQLGLFDHIVALMGIDKLRFLLPVFPGDTIESKVVVESKKETSKQDRGVVVFRTTCTNQENANVLEGELTFLFLRNPSLSTR